jgi:cell division protein FtsB
VTATHRWDERRRLRDLERRRRRGGGHRGPVVLQRAAWGLRGWLSELEHRIRRSVQGDRPLIVATIVVMALAVVIVSTPMQSYLDGRERVEHLADKAAALDDANAQLQQRASDLERDTTIELLAREQLGLVRPGEVAYTLIPPEVDRPLIAPPRAAGAGEPDPWYLRLWSEVQARFTG